MSIFNQRIKQGIDSYKEDLKTKDGNVHMLLIETIVDLGEKQKKRIYFKNKWFFGLYANEWLWNIRYKI